MSGIGGNRGLVDPDLLPLVDAFPRRDYDDDALPAMRAWSFPAVMPPELEAATELQRHAAPGPAGAPDVAVLIYRPRGAEGSLPGVFYIHGGGYVTGKAEDNAVAHRSLAVDLNCAVAVVDYRLAPEHPFPGPLEDCYAAFAWLRANAADLRIDAERLGVMGGSAGGGLAAALALLARDRGEFPVAFQHLIYPMLDDRTCTVAEPNPHAGDFIWTRQHNYYGWASYLGAAPGAPDISPYAAPARAQDLRNLPPAFILTPALDLFAEENLEYARRLLRAGVPTELHLYPGAIHGFDFLPGAAVAMKARADSRAALARFLRPR